MEFVLQSERIADYLGESDLVNFSNPTIQRLIREIFQTGQSEIEKIKTAFHYVRDEIAHSKDIQGEKVTCTASEVLAYRQGICYAKSNLLAALLRSQHIPTGFCYQRLLLGDSSGKSYVIHALNAVFIKSQNKWVRLDARGNKKGVDAQFSIDEEKVAYIVKEELDEVNYPMIYARPDESTIVVLKEFTNAMEMLDYLPEQL